MLSCGLRPRSRAERLAVAKLLHRAPLHVAIPAQDDGWLAAQLWISGRVPHWRAQSPPVVQDAALERLGLPSLEREQCRAWIDASLALHEGGRSQSQPLPATQGPQVSVLICTYNRARLLPQAIASARAQSWPVQIVVVNDGASDGTRDYLDRQRDLCVVHQENQGKPTALNAAIAAATGQALLVLDDDDMLLPGALQLLARALFANPRLSAVFGDTVVFDGDSGVPGDWLPATRLPASRGEEGCLLQIPGMPGACLIRSTAQAQAGAYDPSMVRGQDMDMYLRLSRVGPLGSLPLATFLYRSHDGLRGSAAGQWRKSDTEEHTRRFRSFVQPVFERHMAALGSLDSERAHSWALGAHQRGLSAAARALAQPQPGPYTPRQAWIRGQLGLPGRATPQSADLLVVHDGDEGSLPQTLERHSQGKNIWVTLTVPADPLASVRLFWEGRYGTGDSLPDWVQGRGPLSLALSSDPAWSPPPLPGPAWLPPCEARVALYATALALAWPLPQRIRPGSPNPGGPVLGALVRARRAQAQGQHQQALEHLAPLLERYPKWLAGWAFAQRLFTALGLRAEALGCQERLVA